MWMLVTGLGVASWIAWRVRGQAFVNVLDRVALSVPTPAPTPEIKIQVGSRVGRQSTAIRFDHMSTDHIEPNNQRIEIDGDSRAQLLMNGKSFALGVAKVEYEMFGTYTIEPDPGDQISHTLRHSLVAWPTPFEINWMLGSLSPKRKRNLYHRVEWRKSDGTTLVMVARYEDWLYDGSRWWNNSRGGRDTGVQRLTILP